MATETPATPVVSEHWRDAPEPGIYEGRPYEEYARWNAARASFLRTFGRTAAHAREELLNPSPSTDAKDLGHAEHLALLEPELFEATCVVRPDWGPRRSKRIKAAYAAFEEAHKDSEILTQAQMDACRRMRDAAWAHPTARELLRNTGLNEASMVWTDPETGLLCKARPDRITHLGESNLIVDVKTSRDAGQRSFSRDLYNLGYHEAAAHYLDGANELAPDDRKFVFLVLEKEPPYAVACYELDQDAIDLGRDETHKHLRMYRECLETGVWPAYDQGLGFISCPPWAFRAIGGGE